MVRQHALMSEDHNWAYADSMGQWMRIIRHLELTVNDCNQ